jgi:hypothetical protein
VLEKLGKKVARREVRFERPGVAPPVPDHGRSI